MKNRKEVGRGHITEILAINNNLHSYRAHFSEIATTVIALIKLRTHKHTELKHFIFLP